MLEVQPFVSNCIYVAMLFYFIHRLCVLNCNDINTLDLNKRFYTPDHNTKRMNRIELGNGEQYQENSSNTQA